MEVVKLHFKDWQVMYVYSSIRTMTEMSSHCLKSSSRLLKAKLGPQKWVYLLKLSTKAMTTWQNTSKCSYKIHTEKAVKQTITETNLNLQQQQKIDIIKQFHVKIEIGSDHWKF